MTDFIKAYKVEVPTIIESDVPIQRYTAVDVEPSGNTEVDIQNTPKYKEIKKPKSFLVDNLFSELSTSTQKLQAIKNLGLYDILQNYESDLSNLLWIGTQSEYTQLIDKDKYEYIILVDDVENN